jgi:fucose permease
VKKSMILTILLIIIYLAFISLGLPDSLLGSAWPSMHTDIGVSVSLAGVLYMIITGSTIVSSFFSDKLIRRLSTGIVTAISVFMTAVALFGFSISQEFYQLCLCGIPLGLGAGTIDAALNNFVAMYYKAKHMSWLHCFWGVGAMTGPIIMSYCLNHGGVFQQGYQIVAIIQIILAVVLFLTLPLWTKAAKHKNSDNNTEKKLEHKVLSLKQLINLPGAKQVLFAFFCYSSLESTTGLWGSSFVVLIHGVSVKTAASWTSLFYFGITIGRFFAGFITMKLNHRQMIRLGESIILIGIISMLLPFAKIFLCAGFILIGIGCAPIFPSLLHETPDNFGAEYSQSIMGIQMACAYAGGTFMPLIFGFLASRISYVLLPYYTGGILLLMFVMVEILNKRVDGRFHK